MKFNILQSGSDGNSTLIQSGNTNILIDCGITKKHLVERLKEFNVSLDDIDAIFITHEHIDHIRCLDELDLKKVYASKGTLNKSEINIINPYEFYNIKDIKIMPIEASHDVANCVGYIVADDQVLVYLTDTGIVYDKNLEYMKDADYYILESNHNIEALITSIYPTFLKQRIASQYGHLSNAQCGETLVKVIGPHTKKIVLAHLSKNANNPELALSNVKKILDDNKIDVSNIEIVAASRDSITRGN